MSRIGRSLDIKEKSMPVCISKDHAAVLKVISTLLQHIDELPWCEQFAENWARVVHDPSYLVVVSDDGPSGTVSAAGVITSFLQPMANSSHVLGVEALWFSDDDL